jgi:hypothetical protein
LLPGKAGRGVSMPNKIIVAVHGIGDQVRCETIQAVAYQVSRYYHQPAGIPLGRLHTDLVQLDEGSPPSGVYMVKSGPLKGIGFAEAYWADIPRGPAKERYTLEESKKWARTVVERIRGFDPPGHRTAEDYRLAAQVIEEMIEGIRSIERLLFLARFANLMSFDLRQLLVDYLGDVQVVAEFGNYRTLILTGFQQVLSAVHAADKDAELYIVAHSEGTVVAFLGILQALRREPLATLPGRKEPPRTDWVGRLRGFMTIGSPLNKHLFLWPELFQERAAPPGQGPAVKIDWRNYYDRGDPVGFRLDQMWQWLEKTRWDRFFTFGGEERDVGFTRYMFPGKAHTDYWKDEGVFGHFLHEVVKPPSAPEKVVKPPSAPQAAKNPHPRPTDRFWAKRFSPLVPYILAFGLLVLGVFLLYMAVTAFTLPLPERAGEVARNVGALSVVLAGVSVAARIPRLTKSWRWRLGGYVVFALSLLAFPFLITCESRERLGAPVVVLLGKDHRLVETLSAVGDSFLPKCKDNVIPSGGILEVLSLAAVGLVLVALVSWRWPRLGVVPLIVCGVIIVLGVVVVRMTAYHDYLAKRAYVGRFVVDRSRVSEETLERVSFRLYNLYLAEGEPPDFPAFVRDNDRAKKLVEHLPRAPKDRPADEAAAVHEDDDTSADRPLWPVILGGLAFLYLWWVAALTFDLAVVWQHYIRRSAILNRLKELDPNLERAKAAPAQVPG